MGENMKKRIIGLTCCEMEDIEHPSQRTNEDYITAVVKSGAVPLLLPICDDETVIEQQLECIDGLIVIGGVDINPLFYHDTYAFEQGTSSLKRDIYEMKLIRKCSEKKIPILGICRGQQIINVAFGGTLYQDNKMLSDNVFQHQQKEKKYYPIHSIQIEKDSFLYSIFGKACYVNSFHHQSIKDLAKNFNVVARSEDQIIEAIQHQFLDIWAVQFHPEMMISQDKKMQVIFNNFIKKCEGKGNV
jgi:putative glutamine amidotransferase